MHYDQHHLYRQPDPSEGVHLSLIHIYEEWQEFVQPTHAGTAYQVGDKVTFRGERYVCILAHCVWSPADYPAAWQKQSATT